MMESMNMATKVVHVRMYGSPEEQKSCVNKLSQCVRRTDLCQLPEPCRQRHG
jgi:hypothetical protein